MGSEQPASVSRASSRLSNAGATSTRSFDYNPQRERISLPIGTRVASRSLWARNQPDVLPEEPGSYTPARRSSLVTGLRQIGDVQQMPMTRSTSNLQMTRKQREEQNESRPSSRRHSEVGSVRPKESAAPTQPALRSKGIPQPAKEAKQRVKPSTEPKSQLGATFKSMLDSSRDISSALLLTTPLTVTSLLHSPTAVSSNKMPTPTVARAATFVVEPRQTQAVTHDTHATPMRPATGQLTTMATASFITDAIESEERARILPKSSMTRKGLPQQANSVPLTSPQRTQPNVASTVTKSPSMSRASSRLSSNSSSTEVVVRPLSHLNTPSAVSLSPDVVVTEYDDSDLEAALAKLAERRLSTTASLPSQRSATRNSNTSAVRDSRRTSPWLRRNMDHYNSQEPKPLTSCGALGLCSSAQGSQHLLERCEVCCKEFVMN